MNLGDKRKSSKSGRELLDRDSLMKKLEVISRVTIKIIRTNETSKGGNLRRT